MRVAQPDPTTGLSQADVAAKIAAGEHNEPLKPLTRSIGQIIAGNTFTLFNAVNLALGALIFTTGSYRNLLFLGVAIINTAIGTFQEIRAKRQIDHLSILAATPVTVRRAGHDQQIPQEGIVRDDILQLRRGDQVPVDGEVVAGPGLEADESPLTGEANAIAKPIGSTVLSGSFIVAGSASVHVTKIGSETFAAGLALEAKAEKAAPSQLLNTINRIIQVLTWVLIPLGLALFTVSMVRRGNYNRAILTTSAAVIGMIPEGLVLLTNVALAVSARHLAAKKVLVRALPAIEALARVDVICLDKTGTITSGELRVAAVQPEPGHTEAAVANAAAAVVAALNDDNETARAIKAHGSTPPSLVATATMPFSSARKWSGASFGNGQTYIMGAPEFTFGAQLTAGQQRAIAQATGAGYRVLAVGTAPSLALPLHDLTMLGLILIADTVRPTAKATFAFFGTQDVALKVISGDNPITVANVAKQAGLPGAERAIDMTTVAPDADFAALAERYTVFGRVTPAQKKELISGLQARDHTVAMTGDGVNDVLALRQSDCSIAMATGSEAAKSISDFVLLDSNFAAMTGVLNEGRRVINNIERVASLFLVKTIFSVVLTAIFVFLPFDYPIVPINLTPVSALMVAVPGFLLTLEPNFQRVTGRFLQKVMTIAAPAAVAIIGYTMVLPAFEAVIHWTFAVTSTMVVLLLAVIAWHVLFIVARPFNRYKFAMLVALLGAVFCLFFLVGRPFSLANLWRWPLLLVYGPLVASTPVVYAFLQEFLGKRILARIRWRT